MIKIKKIEFNNYRQYKNWSVSFNDNKEYNLYVLRAKNGTGKTTFLNGILWCLYAKEYYTSDSSKALKVINESTIQNAKIGDVVEVNIKLTISDNEKIISFERMQKFSISSDPLTTYKKAIPTCDPMLKVFETSNTEVNSKVYESEDDTSRIVKQYFDEEIYSYYFFDGENLRNYFDKKNSDKVKQSIYSLSQVNLLENARKRTETLSSEKSRDLTKKDGFDDMKIYDEIDQLEDEIEKLEKNNKEYINEKPVLEMRIKELDGMLAGYKPTRDKQLKRNELERKLKQLQKDQKEFISKKKEFIRTYYVLFSLYPRIKSTYDMIKYKENNGELPPRIDKKQIEELINNHDSNCPMCDNELNDHAIIHMKQLLEELDVSSQTSNYLSSIKSSLESAINKCEKYVKDRKDIIEKEKYYQEEISSTEKELDEISKYLSTYSDNSDSVTDISKLENERSQLNTKLELNIKQTTLNEEYLKNDKKRHSDLKEKVQDMEKNINEKNLLRKQIDILRNLSSSFDQVKKSLMDEIKIEVEEKTWYLFKNMIWKKETFNKLEINDDYQMSVYNNSLNDMTGSLSATESMALAYSFTLAIHEASGRNCPLVVDSPLGRVSDDNRINMAKELLKISKNKQIIMLFTPDEYSSEVADLYDNKIAKIIDVSLTGDETEVERVG